MSIVVPLPDWYPSLHQLWVREGRRLTVPLSERVGYAVHHTAGGGQTSPLAYARQVANQHYAAWNRPGGYNFMIGTDGIIRAMCGWGHVGAHAPGANRNRIGVAFQGTFATSVPNAAQRSAFGSLVASHTVPNSQTGHRDHSATTCPGATLYGALPLPVGTTPDPPVKEDDDMRSMLTRISNSEAVYYIPDGMRHVTRHEAALIVEHAGLEPGPAADIVTGNRWQKHVRNMSRGEAQHLIDGAAKRATGQGGGGGLSQSQADGRYVRRGSTLTLP